MKKRIAWLLSVFMATILAVSLSACGEMSGSEVSGTQSQTTSAWEYMDIMKNAVERAGFDFQVPSDDTPSGIGVIPGKMIEVTYQHNIDDREETIVLRKSPEEGDISGDPTEYPEHGTLHIGDVEIQTRKDGDTIYVAYFTAFDGSYSVGCTTGMTSEQVISIMQKLLELNAK